jgi:alcohol dehydrogenase class IV
MLGVLMVLALSLSLRPVSSLASARAGLSVVSMSTARRLQEVSGHNAAFLSPRILLCRGTASTHIRSTLQSLNLHKPLLILGQTGLQRLRTSLLEPALGSAFDFDHCVVTINGEPTVEQAVEAAKQACYLQCDSILAVGGGSALDLGKAAAALAPNLHRDVFDFLEVIGKAMPLEHSPLPMIAVPTTAGTGSECTKNAVVKSHSHQRKVSLRHEKMLPAAAILDATLTLSCPPKVTAAVGMDALCQLIEPFICNSPNPFVDALSVEGMKRAARSLRIAVQGEGEEILQAREDMLIASSMGGLALANAKLGLVHGFAAVLGGMYENAPHGALCAVLLPYVFKANVEALQEKLKAVNSQSLEATDIRLKLNRFVEVSKIITGNPNATIEDGVAWLHALLKDIHIPALSTMCSDLYKEELVTEVVQATLQASSTKGNPLPLSADIVRSILKQAL